MQYATICIQKAKKKSIYFCAHKIPLKAHRTLTSGRTRYLGRGGWNTSALLFCAILCLLIRGRINAFIS